MTPHPGDLLSDRYRLTELIAIGGMGQVWQARDEMLGRDVAVKILRPELARQAGFLARFRVEARHAARFSHTNVAQIYDYGEIHDDGPTAAATSAYLVMELVPGEPLSTILAEEGVLEPGRVLDLIAQTGWGLGAAHATGVVHRDVKPGNLMVTPDGLIKITDFGVAVAKGDASLTETGQVMGTSQYLAPEQAVGEEVTPASDIYALGVVAYQCLAGRLPFQRESPVATALAHVHDPVPDLPDDVPGPTSELIRAMLRKEPSERPANGRDVAAAANSILAGFTPAQRATGQGSQGTPISPAAGAGGVPPARLGRADPGERAPGPETSTLAYRSVAASGNRAAAGQTVLPTGPRRRSLRLPLAALVLLLVLLIALAFKQGFSPSVDPESPGPVPSPTQTQVPSNPTVTQSASSPSPSPSLSQPSAPPTAPSQQTSTGQGDGSATGALSAPTPVVGQTGVVAPSADNPAPPPDEPPVLPSPTPVPPGAGDPEPTPPKAP